MNRKRSIPLLSSALFLILLTVLRVQADEGDSLWAQTYGGLDWDEATALVKTSDGGYLLAGKTLSFGSGGYDFWLVKADEDGDSLWSRTYGGSEMDWARSVIETSDGGYLVAGQTASLGAGGQDVWLIKTDENGDSLWSATFGGAGYDWADEVREVSDGGFIVGGTTNSFGLTSYDMWLIRTDADGELLWSVTYGGSQGAEQIASLVEVSTGGFLLAGWTESYGVGGYDLWLLRTDENGDSLWSKTFGGAGDDWARSVMETSGGDFVAVGWTESVNPGYDTMWMVKIGADGDSIWTMTYGPADQDGKAFSVIETSDGGYLLGGELFYDGPENNNLWLVKTDSDGNMTMSRTYGGVSDEWASAVVQDGDEYLAAGRNGSYGAGNGDMWLLCVEGPQLGISPGSEIPPPSPLTVTVFPNPFNPQTTISYTLPAASRIRVDIFDGTGKRIGAPLVDRWQNAGFHEISFDGSGLASGIYVYEIRAGSYRESGKMLLLK